VAVGGGGVFALVGELGVGKTRLLSEFASAREKLGERVLFAGPDPAWAGVPFHPIGQWLTRLLGIGNGPDQPWRAVAERHEFDEVERAGLEEVFSVDGLPGIDPEART